jgi:hypothetical protein
VPGADPAAGANAATDAVGLTAVLAPDFFARGRGFLLFDLAEAFAIPSTRHFLS